MTAAADGRETADETRLVAEGIVTGYEAHEVLHGVSIESREGITCIFGPNGSGKSTLLKAINGILPVWEGEVRFGETSLTDLDPEEIVRSGVVTLPQGGGVFTTLTVRENLKLGGFIVEDQDVVRERMDHVLNTFPDLEGKLDAKTKSLSGGQQMMVSLGRSMMTGADIYLMDEPSAGLAPTLVEEAFELIETLIDQGAHVIVVEQNVRAALPLAEYVYILAEGEMQFAGPPSELADRDELLEVYLGIGG